MHDEVFYKKNELGVNVLYTVVGYYSEGNDLYAMYTDFVEDDSEHGYRLFVGKRVNGVIQDVEESKRKQVIDELFSEINKKIV